MSLNQIPVFNVLRSSMNMLTDRQNILAENIANSDTPGFVPNDVDEKGFQKALGAELRARGGHSVNMKTTNPLHFRAPGVANFGSLQAKIMASPDSETTLNGNAVVLEEQVASLADTRMRYDTAIGLYKKSLSLLRLAMKSPGV